MESATVIGGSVSARAPVRSGNPDWLPDSPGRVAGSPRTWKVRPESGGARRGESPLITALTYARRAVGCWPRR
eukprot:2545197-Prymnesium_polylepis.1